MKHSPMMHRQVLLSEPQFEHFLHLLFCQYPSLQEWLHAHSPDPQRTQQMWYRTLSGYTFDECVNVLDQWNSLLESPLKPYTRDMVARLIASTADRNRDYYRSIQQRAHALEQRDAYLSAQSAPPGTNMLAQYRAALELRAAADRGEVDLDQAQQQIEQLVEGVT